MNSLKISPVNRQPRRLGRALTRLGLSLGLGVSVLVAGLARADDTHFQPFDLYYSASWGAMGVGDVEISLKPQGTDGCFEYRDDAHPTALVRALYGAPVQVSHFCVVGGQIRSQSFSSELPGDDKQSYKLSFDWSGHQVTDGHGVKREIPDDAIDILALQQAARLWIRDHAEDKDPPLAEFTMVDGKNLTHYKLKVQGHEKVRTPAGEFDTVLLERIDNPNRVGKFWLAPSRDYMPVRIQTKNGDKPTVELLLKS